MSTIKTTNITHGSNSGTANVVLDSSGNTTVSSNLTVTGTGGNVVQYTDASGSWTAFGTGAYKDITVDSTDVIKYEIYFKDVSPTGNTDWQFQIGDSGGVETSGYEVTATYMGTSNSNESAQRSDAWRWYGNGNAAVVMNGKFTLTRISGNEWWGEGQYTREGDAYFGHMWGFKELSAALTTIHISASSDDSSNFDGGTYKIISYK